MMFTARRFQCVLVLLVGLYSCQSWAETDIDGNGSNHDGSENRFSLVLLSAVTIATTFCFVLLVFGCACCWNRGFAKFDETSTQETITGQSYTNFNDFSPPAQSTPSFPPGLEPDTVTIEPLPDLAARAAAAGASPGSLGQQSWLKAGGGMPDQVHQGDIKHIHNPRFQFPRSQLSYVDEMGTGWFGKVLQGEAHRLHAGLRKTRVVIKQLRDTTTAEEQVVFLQEVQPFREINHPNVLMLLGQCIESMPFLLILEYAPFGDLKGYLRKHQDMVQDMAHRDVQLRMACDMVSGLMWLHQADFIHIDLAARNCLVCADTSIKIGDYGLSLERYPEDYYVTKDSRHAVPIRWLGPEVIEITETDMVPKTVTKESNVWSFGVIMLELCTGGNKPYPNLSNEEVLKQVVMEQEIRLDKPSMDVRYASRWFEIMMFCWMEADMRPSMKEIHELLMHLRSNRDRIDMDDFQQRWDTLKPQVAPDSSESSKTESQFSESREDDGYFETIAPPTDFTSSGIANGFVSAPHGQIGVSGVNPNINMNANVNSGGVDAGGDLQSTLLGFVSTSDSKPSSTTTVAPTDLSHKMDIDDALDFVIQPTVAEDTETAPPKLGANEAGDSGFALSLEQSSSGQVNNAVGVTAPIPAPMPAGIPEVLISSPTSEPDMDDEEMFFEEAITPVVSNDVQSAAAPTTRDPFNDSDMEPNTMEEDDGIKQITNPLFQLDSEPITATTPDLSMTTPSEANGTAHDVSMTSPTDANGTEYDSQRTSTPSRTFDLMGGETPGSDEDSSLSFMSATSVGLKKDGEDSGDASSYKTMTSQSDDPSFFSFNSSPFSSGNPSLSTDGSFKTIADSSLASEADSDDNEKTFVDQSASLSELEDGIGDVDETPGKGQPGFVSLSGHILLHHQELPAESSPSSNLESLHGTMFANTRSRSNSLDQSQMETSSSSEQQKTLEIKTPVRSGSFTIKVSSKKVAQTSVKHTREVRQVAREKADLLKMYKKGDDVAIVKEVKSHGSSDDLSQTNQSESTQGVINVSSSQELLGDITQIGLLDGRSTITHTQHGMMQKTKETHRTITVVHNVKSSSSEREQIIDLMSSSGVNDPTSSRQQEQMIDLMSSPGDNNNTISSSQQEQMIDLMSSSGDNNNTISSSQQEQWVDLMSSPSNTDSRFSSPQQRIIDLMSAPAVEDNTSFSTTLLQSSSSPSLIEPSVVQSPATLEPMSSTSSLIPDLMGDVPGNVQPSSATALIPDLMGDVPVNVEHTMSLSPDGDGLMTMNWASQGGGLFTTEGEEGQSTQVDWSTSTNVQHEQTVSSSTARGLPKLTFTLNKADDKDEGEDSP